MIKERPILFSCPMVRAILDGRKTQTRRIVKPQPNEPSCNFSNLPWCIGTKLWVRETIKRAGAGACWYAADNQIVIGTDPLTKQRMPAHYQYKRDVLPSIYMPKDWCRITLEITGVRVERLNEISMEDCCAEGIDADLMFSWLTIDPFKKLWNSINGAGSWDANPLVWVINFKGLRTND